MKALELEIFCDEIHKEYLHQDHSHWMYIGILFVPLDLKAELISHLLSMRCIQHESWQWDESLCLYKCGFHERNDTEIHYSNIHKTSAKYKIGLRWLHDFLIEKNNKKNNGLVYFNVLGLNLTRMNLDSFGTNGSRDLTIYNKFFRTTLKSGANYCFGLQLRTMESSSKPVH